MVRIMRQVTQRRPGTTTLAVLALTLVGGALRFATLDARGFWQDEVATVFLVRDGFLDMFEAVARDESNPPLYYVLTWVWTRLFGDGEVGIRSLSALAGTLTVPLAYLAGRELVTRRAGVATAAIVAVNPLLIWYSQEARNYALLVLLTVASFYFFARALGRGATSSFVLWALLSVLAVATHYFAAFVVVAEGLWLLAARRTRAVALSFGLVVATAAAWLPLAVSQRENPGFITATSLITRVQRLGREFAVAYEPPAGVVLGTIAFALGFTGLVLVVLRGARREQQGALVAGSVAVAAVAVPLALALAGADYFLQRNVLAALIPSALVAGTGFGAERARRLGPLAATLFCGLCTAVVIATADTPKYRTEDWRRAAAELDPPTGDRAIVATPESAALRPLAYYLAARRLHREDALVREVAVIAMASDGGDAPRSRTPPPPGPAFRLVERREESRFTLLSFAARRPVRVSASSLGRLALDPDPAVLLQARSASTKNREP
jgi:4-amino-4-deoxy-L-arabinose transferase-like glycosyltransferase